MAGRLDAMAGHLENLLETTWFGSFQPNFECGQLNKAHVSGGLDPGSFHSVGVNEQGGECKLCPHKQSMNEECGGLHAASEHSTTLPMLSLPAPGSIAAAVAKLGRPNSDLDSAVCTTLRGLGNCCAHGGLQCPGLPNATPRGPQPPPAAAKACQHRNMCQGSGAGLAPVMPPASVLCSAERQVRDMAWHFRFRKRWLGAYQTENCDSIPLIDPGLMLRARLGPKAIAAAAGAQEVKTPVPTAVETFDSVQGPLMLCGDSPDSNTHVLDGTSNGQSPAVPSPFWSAAQQQLGHNNKNPMAGFLTAPGIINNNDKVNPGSLSTGDKVRPSLRGAVSAPAAPAEDDDDGLPYWVGPLLPPVAVELEGQFNFVLAKVVDSLAGCSAVVLRGRRRANTAQLVEDLKLEAARRAIEACLPVQASITLLASGSMVVQGKHVTLACAAPGCVSLPQGKSLSGSQGSSGPAAGENIFSLQLAGATQAGMSNSAARQTSFDLLQLPSSASRAGSCTSSSNCNAFSCAADTMSPAAAAAAAAAAEAALVTASEDACAMVARMLYESLPYDYRIVRALDPNDSLGGSA